MTNKKLASMLGDVTSLIENVTVRLGLLIRATNGLKDSVASSKIKVPEPNCLKVPRMLRN